MVREKGKVPIGLVNPTDLKRDSLLLSCTVLLKKSQAVLFSR